MNWIASRAMLVAILIATTGLGNFILASNPPAFHGGPATNASETNQPPTLSMPANISVLHGSYHMFTANASDPDGDTLRFTWYWGDGPNENPAGTPSVTTAPNASHVYSRIGDYLLQVHVDDLTGLDGHNVSATTCVRATCITPPTAVTVALELQTFYYVDQVLTFTGSAQDPDGDAMQFWFYFGDGNYTIVNNSYTGPNQVVTNSTTHTYAAAGTYGYYMSATDGLVTTSSYVTPITVYLNHTPAMVPQTPKTGNQGVALPFAATATDLDGDNLRYTWNFGDGSAPVVSRVTTHKYLQAGYYNFSVYVDDLTGIPGHNVSSTAKASIAFNLTLLAGWNFVSIPLTGYGYKASTLGLSVGDMVLNWDYFNRTYHAYIKGISPAGQDFKILPGLGYWIWVSASKTLHVLGANPTTAQTITIYVPSDGGWFPVGLNSQKTWHAHDIQAMYSGPASISIVAIYEPPVKTYRIWLSALPSMNDFSISPGVGFWIWVTAPGGTLTYTP